jgi:hypothetical protein
MCGCVLLSHEYKPCLWAGGRGCLVGWLICAGRKPTPPTSPQTRFIFLTLENTSTHQTLMMMMMMTAMVVETSVKYGHLTRLIAREDYIKLGECVSLTICIYNNLRAKDFQGQQAVTTLNSTDAFALMKNISQYNLTYVMETAFPAYNLAHACLICFRSSFCLFSSSSYSIFLSHIFQTYREAESTPQYVFMVWCLVKHRLKV